MRRGSGPQVKLATQELSVSKGLPCRYPKGRRLDCKARTTGSARWRERRRVRTAAVPVAPDQVAEEVKYPEVLFVELVDQGQVVDQQFQLVVLQSRLVDQQFQLVVPRGFHKVQQFRRKVATVVVDGVVGFQTLSETLLELGSSFGRSTVPKLGLENPLGSGQVQPLQLRTGYLQRPPHSHLERQGCYEKSRPDDLSLQG